MGINVLSLMTSLGNSSLDGSQAGAEHPTRKVR